LVDSNDYRDFKDFVSQRYESEELREARAEYERLYKVGNTIAYNTIAHKVSELKTQHTCNNERYEHLEGVCECLEDICQGFQYLKGVPLDVQLEACAMVAGVSVEKMKKRIEAVSSTVF